MLLGIEIGGTKLQLGLGRGDGAIEHLITLAADPRGGASRIREQIEEAYQSAGWQVSAVGIGFGGPVDAGRGLALASFQVQGWNEFPLAEWACRVFGVSRAIVQNDADTAALGEARFGAGVGMSPVLYVNSGSGIGGGLIVDGRIYRGAGLGAVEIGHLNMIEGSSPPQSLESLASGWAIAERARAAAQSVINRGETSLPWIEAIGSDPSRITAATVAELASQFPGSAPALILQAAATTMGRALAIAVTLLAPRRIILGGGVAQMEEALWLEPIRRTVEQEVFPPFRGRYEIATAALRQDVVIHGALALARDAATS